MKKKKRVDYKEQIELMKELKRDSFAEYSLLNSEVAKYLSALAIFIATIATLVNIFSDSIIQRIALALLFILVVGIFILMIYNFREEKRIRKEIANHYQMLADFLSKFEWEK